MTENHKDNVKNSSNVNMGQLSLLFGIAGILFIAIPVVSFTLGVVGLILSIASVRDSNKKNRKPGVANAGLTTSVIAVVLAILMVIVPIMYAGVKLRAEQSAGQSQQ